MIIKRMITAAAAVALAATPTLAAAQSAAPLSLEGARASQSVEGNELGALPAGGPLVGLALFVLIVVAIYFVAEEDEPESP